MVKLTVIHYIPSADRLIALFGPSAQKETGHRLSPPVVLHPFVWQRFNKMMKIYTEFRGKYHAAFTLFYYYYYFWTRCCFYILLMLDSLLRFCAIILCAIALLNNYIYDLDMAPVFKAVAQTMWFNRRIYIFSLTISDSTITAHQFCSWLSLSTAPIFIYEQYTHYHWNTIKKGRVVSHIIWIVFFFWSRKYRIVVDFRVHYL